MKIKVYGNEGELYPISIINLHSANDRVVWVNIGRDYSLTDMLHFIRSGVIKDFYDHGTEYFSCISTDKIKSIED